MSRPEMGCLSKSEKVNLKQDKNDQQNTKNEPDWASRKEDYRARFRALKWKTHDQHGFQRIKVVWGVLWNFLVNTPNLVKYLISKQFDIGLHVSLSIYTTPLRIFPRTVLRRPLLLTCISFVC